MKLDAFLADLFADEARIIKCAPHPKRWQDFAGKHQLAWHSCPFKRNGSAAVPAEPGFYCFVVANAAPNLPAVFFPLYAGETENLQRRYGDYIREKSSPKGRVQVRKFLNVFSGEVAFAFAPYASDTATRRSVEKELNDALMPPYSQKDFSAEVKRKKAAWQ
jgi:hypothetical protein